MLTKPDADSDTALADWLEASILFRSAGYLAFSDVLENLEAFDLDGGAEEAATRLVRRIHQRAAAIGPSYPIAVEKRGYSTAAAWDGALIYGFLVLLSLGHHYRSLRLGEGQASEPGEMFELVCTEALSRYVAGEAIRFGAPRRRPVPPGFAEAVAYLAGKALVHPQGRLETGSEKDDGLDIVAWRPFRDGRPGHSIILAQCAVGAGWRMKYGDLKYELWTARVAWNVTPARAFLAPIELDLDAEEWRKTLYEFGVVLDRLRISSLIDDGSLSEELAGRLREWCVRRIGGLPSLE
jgi:hypothetical protein